MRFASPFNARCFPSTLIAVAALLIVPAAARAQAIYAMASAGHYSGLGVGPGTPSNQSGGITAKGGTFGVYDNFLPLGPVKLGGDARVFVQNSGNGTPYGNKLQGALFGLRLALGIPAFPLRPYIQAELGTAATNNGTSTVKSWSGAYQVQGGVDFTIFPHLDARGEYGAGQMISGSPSHTLQEFGIGLVLRLY